MDYNGKVLGSGGVLAVTGVVNVWLAVAVGLIILTVALAIRFGWRKNKNIEEE